MELAVTSLVCGRNGTGFSALVAARRSSLSPGDEETRTVVKVVVNAGDGLARCCVDRCVKLSKVRCIICTSLAPHCTAGLPGLLLSLSSLGVGEVTLIGPRGIQGLYASMLILVNRKCVASI